MKSTAKILNGRELADNIKNQLAKNISQSAIRPSLAVILVGDNQASHQYVNLKEKSAREIGIDFHKYLCNSECYPDIDEYELLEMIEFLNNDNSINGIIVQLPLPKDFDQNKITKAIKPQKDVDGFNGGAIIPPTISAVIELLKATKENLISKKTLIIGKSDIFTAGMEKFLKQELQLQEFKITNSIPDDSIDYDIIIIALGQAHCLKKQHLKKDAIVIDIGINKLDGRTVGDADPKVAEIASFLSPVPGGVGPLTVACLLRNTYELANNQNNLDNLD